MICSYENYIVSNDWKKLRQSIIDRDKVCRGCGSDENLQVHHSRYPERFKKENEIVSDWSNDDPKYLSVFCSECHDLFTNKMRKYKYSIREIKINTVKNLIPIRKNKKSEDKKNETTSSKIQINRGSAAFNAQRIACRSVQCNIKSNESSIEQEKESGRRLRGNGEIGIPRRVISE